MVDPTVHFDTRWFGAHGIGRFAAEVFRRLPEARPLAIAGPKLSPFDPLASTWALMRLREGRYFSPGFNPPLASPIPFVFTIHDLIHLKVPGESSALRRLYYETIVRPGVRKARCVLTVSEFSRRDILEWTGADPAHVRVVGNGVAAQFQPQGRAHAPGYPYFLHVGRRASHKNVARLLQAFAGLRGHGGLRLLFTGPPDAATQTLARQAGVLDAIDFAGERDDDGLAMLYRGAVALVFPSLYEGFGLPVVEAMACGTAVLTSGNTSLAEVAGESHALLVDPTRADAIGQAMQQLLDDNPLRERLRAGGPARAALFNWDAVATRVRASLG